MYSLRTFTCPDCGTSVEKHRPAAAVVRCGPCAVAYSAEEQRQLAAHEGPHYERWRWAWLKGIHKTLKESPRADARRVA